MVDRAYDAGVARESRVKPRKPPRPRTKLVRSGGAPSPRVPTAPRVATSTSASALPGDALPSLERARAALAAHDFATARDALIDAWRCRRAPELAELVATVAERAPDDLAAKLAEVVTPRVASSLHNLVALRGVDDPRLSKFAIDALVQLPFTAETAARFLGELIAVVERHADVRVIERAPAIETAIQTRIKRLALRQKLVAQLQATIARYVKAPAPASAAEAAIESELARLLEPVRRPARSAEALLADIYANPDDDAPRLVLADLLLERGDPRGELIMLQLERPTGEPTPRELELLKRHGKAWMGNLAPVLSWGRGYARTKFRRGFVAKADIILSVGKKLEPIRTEPAWATVEELDGSWDWELLLSAPLRALRVIERQVSPAEISKLARRREPLATVRQIWVSDPASIDRSALHAAFPQLATLAMYWHAEGAHDLAVLGALGVGRIELTHNWARGADLAPAIAAFDKRLAELVGSSAPVARLCLHAPRGAPVELVRDAAGRFARA